MAYLKSLVDYWRHEFDWRAQEAKLNEFAHSRTQVEAKDDNNNGSVGIHYIHERGKGQNPMPLLLIHGWPDPARFGGDPADSFDVIVPSIPDPTPAEQQFQGASGWWFMSEGAYMWSSAHSSSQSPRSPYTAAGNCQSYPLRST